VNAQPGAYRDSFAFGVLSFAFVGTLSLASGLAVARIYGIVVIGRYALVAAPVAVLWQISTVREQVGLVRTLATLLPRDPRVGQLFAPVLAFSSALTFVAAVLTAGVVRLLYSGPIGHPDLFWPALANIAGYLFFTNTSWNFDAVLMAFRAGRHLFWVRLWTATSYLAAAVALGLVSPTLWNLTIATVLSPAAGLVVRLLIAPRYLRMRIRRRDLREGAPILPEVVRFGLKLTPGTIAEGLTGQAGIWLLGAISSLATLGAYYRALLLENRLLELGFRVNEVLFPTLVERRTARDEGGFDRAVVDSARYLAIGLVCAAAVGGGCAHGLMALYGPGFSRASTVLALLLLVPPFASIGGVQSHVLTADERPLATSVVAIGRLALVIGLTVMLGLWIGVTGAALALTLGYAANVVCLQLLVRKHLAAPLWRLWPLREVAALGLAYVAGFGASRALDRLIHWPAGLGAGLVAGSALFTATFVLAGGLNARDRSRLSSLRSRQPWSKVVVPSAPPGPNRVS
jgi:O-antigen/teichoic acid export membrane protein